MTPKSQRDFVFAFKGTVQRDFWPPVFFAIWTSLGLGQWVKIISILVKILLSYSNLYESPRVIIPQQVYLPRVEYPKESVSPRVSYCAEAISLGYATPASHSWPRGVNSHFLKLLHRPLKGQCHKNKCVFFILQFYSIKGLHFVFMPKLFWMNFLFDSPGMIPQGVSCFCQAWVEFWKQTGGKKYRWTFPLKK